MNANFSMHRLLLYSVIAAIVSLSPAAFLLPGAPSIAHESANHVRMMLTVVMAAAYCGAAVLFLAGLSNFKANFKAAYRWLAIGMILFGLAMLQWPIIVLRDLANSVWAVSGVVVIPFIVATAFMYVGMRRFAKILGIRTWLNAGFMNAVAILGVAVLSGLVAHFFATNNTADIGTETYTATVAWSTGFGWLAFVLAGKIRKVIGAEYRPAMTALWAALGALTFAGLHEYGGSFFLTERQAYIYWGTSLWPFVLAALLMVWAGHAFGATASQGNRRNDAETAAASSPADYIGDIVEVAGLASRPEDIDLLLDNFRTISALLDAGATPSLEQQAALLRIYRQLEDYLTTRDPLRTFTKEQVRERVSPAMRQALQQGEQPAPQAPAPGTLPPAAPSAPSGAA